MALFHMSAKIMSRAKGESACAASAYRSGERIESEYDGRVYDYSRKKHVVFSTVLLPENAPAEYADRQQLWNAVEKNENIKGQLAREIEFSLPRELDEETNTRIALEFIKETFVNEGMIADIAFHNPPKMDSHKRPLNRNGEIAASSDEYIYNNPHVHVLLTMRPMDSNGNWEPKKEKLYICEKDGQRRRFSALELKGYPDWEKLYSYTDGKEKSWHTKSHAAVHPELKQVNKHPKSESRTNPKVEEWNSPDTLIKWRAAWADKVNIAVEEMGLDERVDHRSYADQGLELIPTVHEGKAVTIEEKRLQEEYEKKLSCGEDAVQEHTEIRSLNIAIHQHNEGVRLIIELRRIKSVLDTIIEEASARISYLSHSLAEKLEHLRASMIVTKIWENRAAARKAEASERIQMTEDLISSLNQPDNLSERRETLENELSKARGRRKKEILEKLEALEYEVSIHEENIKYASQAREEVLCLRETSERASRKILTLRERFRRLKKTYDELNDPDVEKMRLKIRPDIESQYQKYIGPRSFQNMAEVIDSELCCKYAVSEDFSSMRRT